MSELETQQKIESLEKTIAYLLEKDKIRNAAEEKQGQLDSIRATTQNLQNKLVNSYGAEINSMSVLVLSHQQQIERTAKLIETLTQHQIELIDELKKQLNLTTESLPKLTVAK